MHMPISMPSRSWDMSDAREMADKAVHSRMGAPWAVLGMFTAFLGGAVLGMVGAKKKMAMSGGGPCGHSYDMSEGHGWAMKHHHHGYGEGPCRQKHDMMSPAAQRDAGERDEGE